MSLEENAPAPDFTLPATQNGKEGNTQSGELSLADLRGQPVVIYFYPRDNTPGCTQEGQDFAALYPAFRKAGAQIIGISRDSLRKHENFSAKFDFPFPLASDEEGKVCEAFDVMREKKMYGKTHIGIERSTFVIDSAGTVRHVWRKVKVNGHAQAVLEAVQAL